MRKFLIHVHIHGTLLHCGKGMTECISMYATGFAKTAISVYICTKFKLKCILLIAIHKSYPYTQTFMAKLKLSAFLEGEFMALWDDG